MISSVQRPSTLNWPAVSRPRLGFLGTGWIGRNRLQAIADDRTAEIVALADPATEAAERAARLAPGAKIVDSLGDLLALDLDGLVIATPSGQHAEQSLRALERGVAVFCQKPLGRNTAEVREVVEAARAADQLLGVDLSYRHIGGLGAVRQSIREGALGKVFALDLVFHNAYGPDKAWFYDRARSGGGCVMDLGIHLVDLALWLLDFPNVNHTASRLFANGVPLTQPFDGVEDYAVACLELEGGVTVTLSCSWRLHAGCDAAISAGVYGTQGGAALRNLNGSFYDFTVEQFQGTTRKALSAPPEAWGGRAAVHWARRLAAGAGYDPEAEHLIPVAAALDSIYGR